MPDRQNTRGYDRVRLAACGGNTANVDGGNSNGSGSGWPNGISECK